MEIEIAQMVTNARGGRSGNKYEQNILQMKSAFESLTQEQKDSGAMPRIAIDKSKVGSIVSLRAKLGFALPTASNPEDPQSVFVYFDGNPYVKSNRGRKARVAETTIENSVENSVETAETSAETTPESGFSSKKPKQSRHPRRKTS